LRDHPTKTAVLTFSDPQPEHPLPYELKPRNDWIGLIEQVTDLVHWGTSGVLYFDLYHSHRAKPVRRRVRFSL
jgi:hypothetical protein